MARRRAKSYPILQGEPSPSLAKMNRMNAEALTAQAERLKTEADRLKQKLANLQNIKPPPKERIDMLNAQLARVELLEKLARERLAGKIERRETFQQRPGFGPPRPGGPGGPQGGFRRDPRPGGGGGYSGGGGTSGSGGYSRGPH